MKRVAVLVAAFFVVAAWSALLLTAVRMSAREMSCVTTPAPAPTASGQALGPSTVCKR